MRKKLFAVIMSVMMMVTFMPAMAFADTPLTYTVKSWGSDYKTVTVKASNDKTYTVPTTVEFHQTADTTADAGQYTAIPDFSEYAALTGATPATAGENIAHFYDLSKAVFTNDLKYSTMEKGMFDTLFNGTEDEMSWTTAVVKFVEPATATTPKKETAAVTLSGYTVKLAKPAYDKTKEFEDQTFEGLQAYVVRTAGDEVVVSNKASADAINLLPVRKITVSAATPTVNSAKFSIDKFKADGTAVEEIVYDGKDHAIVTNTVPTVSITKYELLNTQTGKYEEVANPSVKDAKTYNFKVWVKVGNADPVSVSKIFKVKAVKATFSLKSSATVYESVKYELEDLVQFTTSDASLTQKDVDTFVKANKALVKEYLDSFYTFTSEKTNELSSADLTVKMTQKSEEEVVAAEKKYKEVFGKNISITRPTGLEFTSAVKVNAIEGNELVACDQTKTYHVKKAKALKAKKTFKMKGDYVKVGTASYFKKSGNSKIVVAKDGTVTVKKGLKKGTYKVKVKVTAPNKSPLTDTKTLTVKIKK